MSGLVQKVKDAISGEKHTPEAVAANQGSNEYTADGSKLSHSGIGQSNTGGDPLRSGRGNTLSENNTTSGTGRSNYDSTAAPTTHTGPHSSKLANEADPRVDSDLDGSRHAGTTTGSGLTGTSSGHHSTTGGSTNVGPHSSNVGNKVDPRVDSDLDPARQASGMTGADSAGTGAAAATTIGSGRHHGQGSSDYNRTSGITGSGYGSSDYDRSTRGDGLSGYGSSVPDNPRSTNAGPHSSNLGNKADPRVDSDLDSNRGSSGLTGSGDVSGASATGSSLTGAETKGGTHGHQGDRGGITSRITGKVEDIVHGGAHHTETANRLDPHVSGGSTTEGDLEHATIPGTGRGTGSITGTSSGYGSNSIAGPHKSNLLNKMDPRVDSDLSSSRGVHGPNTMSSSGLTGTSGGYGSNTTGISSGHDTNTGLGQTSSTTAGPHSSNLANKADPRVDSDLSGSRSGGSTTAGPHNPNIFNKADPRVDSDLSGSRGGSGYNPGTSEGYGSSTGTGYDAPIGSSTGLGHNQTPTTGTTNTAGPHSSNLANKADPRVDSDADGSRLR